VSSTYGPLDRRDPPLSYIHRMLSRLLTCLHFASVYTGSILRYNFSPSADFLSVHYLTMASSYISRQRIKLLLSAMEFWAFIRRTVNSLSTNPKARLRFLASSGVVFLMLAVLMALLVAGGSNKPYTATKMEKQGNRGFNSNNLRFMERELDVNYNQGPGKIALMRRIDDSRRLKLNFRRLFYQCERIYGLHPAIVTKSNTT
jgi:hypothetical protein